MPKKDSRLLVVDGTSYRWRVVYDPWYWRERGAALYETPVRVLIQAAEGDGPCLIARFSGGRGQAVEALREPFTPGLACKLIVAGLAKGWTPSLRGSRLVELDQAEVTLAVAETASPETRPRVL
jgi:hypothetical protein